jgi:phospholipase C
MLGGDTFGIKDDDPWYCTPGSTQKGCHASDPSYVAHLVDGPSLATQLRAKGLAWRAYLEDIPAPGSLEPVSPATDSAPASLYAAKHTGFTNFADELVGFDRLHADLKSGSVPAFALVVPNQCNEMHGIGGPEKPNPKAPADCGNSGQGPLIARGDAYVAKLIAEIQASPVWTKGNTAIILTWDEDGGKDRVNGKSTSCCVTDAHNPGGGNIPTIVITNHGPRGVTDPTPYNHYSMLRTIEDALGLDGHIRHAADVAPMAPLFGPIR